MPWFTNAGDDVILNSFTVPQLSTGCRIKSSDLEFVTDDQFIASVCGWSNNRGGPGSVDAVNLPYDFAGPTVKGKYGVCFNTGIHDDQVLVQDG